MKKVDKVIFIVIIIFLFTSIFNTVFAKINPSDYKPTEFTEEPAVINMANRIIGAFQAIGSIVSVLALVLIGIKYMISSIEEKAEYKETMIYYVIGAVLVFAISNISAVIYNFAKNL